MRIESIRTIEGPNVYHHRPVLVMQLDLQDLVDTPSSEIPGFTDRLLELLPGLGEHQCSRERRGGFVERLREGTYPAHIVEHVTLELSQLAGIPVGFGKARWAGPARELYNVIVRYESQHGMRHLLTAAVELVQAVIDDRPFDLRERLEATKVIIADHELGPSTAAIVSAAGRRGIPWTRLDDEGLVQLGWGRHRRYIQAATTDGTSAIGVDAAGSKAPTKELLDPASIGDAIVDSLFPNGSNGRIPIIAITGTNGKTTVTRMIDHILRGAGTLTGTTTTDGIYLNGVRICKGDTTGPISAATILAERRVETAVLETARGGIVRRGLGFDWCDVGVMTTIQPDHIGQDGIENVEDILSIKSLVAERVREGGTLVLNADDDMLMRLPQERAIRRVPKRIVLYSLDPASDHIAGHRAAGGTVYFLRDGSIVEAIAEAETQIVGATSLPSTLGGLAPFQISNAMAACAACRARGISPQIIARELRTFGAGDHNPGRLSLYRVGNGYVLVDYGHNPDAIAEIARMASRWGERRTTCILGVPGDRDDSVVIAAGRAAAGGFDRFLIREDRDLRGRRPGEIAAILQDAVTEAAPGRECRVVLGEIEALARAISEMNYGEVVVIFYDKIEPILELLDHHGAVRSTAIDGIPHKPAITSM